MTYEEIKAGLAAAGFPLVYYQWPINQAPALPYVVYYYPNRADDPADNVNYGLITALNVELYTKEKSFTDEAEIEEALTAMGLVWDKTETFLDSEQMYEVLYESEVCLNGEN